MTARERLHTRLMGYLKNLPPRSDPIEVAGKIGLTMAKEIDRIAGEVDKMAARIRKLSGEPDA